MIAGLSPTGNNNSRRELEILRVSYLSVLPQQHFQLLHKWALKLPEINFRFPGYQCKGMGEICEPLAALISFMNAPLHCESESHRQTRFKLELCTNWVLPWLALVSRECWCERRHQCGRITDEMMLPALEWTKKNPTQDLFIKMPISDTRRGNCAGDWAQADLACVPQANKQSAEESHTPC